MSEELDWAILERLRGGDWSTAGQIAAAVAEETDVVERRLEALRQRGLIDYCCGTDRIKWTLTIEGRECLATDPELG